MPLVLWMAEDDTIETGVVFEGCEFGEAEALDVEFGES